MDAKHFDRLARSLTALGTRRGLLALLASVPVVGGLFAGLDPFDTDAKGRRKRRKKAHKHGKGRRRKHHKKCKPKSLAKTCAGKCGPVTNNCKKTVDCGSCACDPACEVCFTCQERPNTFGTCILDPAKQGQTCGDPGQVCQANGSCACQAGSCANPTPICDAGVCVGCSDTLPCPTGCCDASGVCQEGVHNAACGFPGQPCTNCAATGERCTDRACICGSGVICSGSGCCPTSSDVCNAEDQCCTPECAGKVCGPDGCGGICQPDSCPDGQTCVNGACACNVTSCPTGCCDEDGECQLGRSDTVCGRAGGACVACAGGRVCLINLGVCAFVECGGSGGCPCGQCFGNLGGDPPGGVCATVAGCTTDCALCAANGQTCWVPNSAACPVNLACATPC